MARSPLHSDGTVIVSCVHNPTCYDPIVLAHARALLTSIPEGRTEYLDADLRDVDSILRSDQLRGVLDLDQPVALLLIAIMHFVPDSDDPYGVAKRLLDALPSGSYLALSHLTGDFDQPVGLMLMNILGHVPDLDEARSIVRRLLAPLASGSHLVVADGTNVVDGPAFEEAIAVWNASGSLPYHLRSPAQLATFFEGLDLVEPGLVSCPRWRPDTTDPETLREVDEFGGVGRKL